MKTIQNFIDNIGEYIQKVIDPIRTFLSHDWYIIYASILFLLVILLVAGLIIVIRKIPKLFFTLTFILALLCIICYFIAYQ